MKECFKCHKLQPLSEFYKHNQMADGHLNKCKDCTRKETKRNRTEVNREYYIAYDKKRAKTEKRKDWLKKRRKSKEELLKARARYKLNNELKKGTIHKEHCYCGEAKTEAHHPDYDQPLFVIWLCHKHHKHIHGRTAL